MLKYKSILYCDTLNKYFLKNTYSFPKVNSVLLKFSFKTLLSFINAERENLKANDIILKIKLFFIFFLFSRSTPLFKCAGLNKKAYFLKDNILNENDYFFYLNFYGKKSIYYFFLDLFFESCDFKNLSFFFIKNLKVNNQSEVSGFLPLLKLGDLDYLLSSLTLCSKISNIPILIKIKLINKGYFFLKKNNVSNLFYLPI